MTHAAFSLFAFFSLEFTVDVRETYCIFNFLCFLYSVDKFKADDLSFLFALTSPSGTQPIKLSAKPSADPHRGGILCRTSMGPCFGSKNYFGIKLCDAIDGNDFLRDGSRAAFICPSNVTLSCFTPETHFNISELEIFKVNFES